MELPGLDGGCDGCDLQELGEKFGLLQEERRTTFCGVDDDGCSCQEVVDHPERGFTCYRRVPLTSPPKDTP